MEEKEEEERAGGEHTDVRRASNANDLTPTLLDDGLEAPGNLESQNETATERP